MYYAPHFTVYTDNKLLTYVLTTAKLNATDHRWVAELSDFHFNVKYRPGTANKDADSLSRIHSDIEQYMDSCTEQVEGPTIVPTIVRAMKQLDSRLIFFDLIFGIKPASCSNYPAYVKEWQTAMKEVYVLSAKRSVVWHEGKKHYDGRGSGRGL